MNKYRRKKNCIYTATATLAVLLTATVAWAEKPNEAASTAKPVVVKNTDPIPVEGDVKATIQGTVPVLVENQDPIPVMGDVNAVVSGIVEVENFDRQLNGLRSEVRQVNDEMQRVREAVESLQGLERIPWTYVWKEEFDPRTRQILPIPGTGWNDTELIVVSAEDDSITVTCWEWLRGPRGNSVKTEVFKAGAKSDEFPTVQTFNLPIPITFREVDVFCWNIATPCEVIITMIGSKPAP